MPAHPKNVKGCWMNFCKWYSFDNSKKLAKSSPRVRKSSLMVTAKIYESLLTKLTNLHVEAEKNWGKEC